MTTANTSRTIPVVHHALIAIRKSDNAAAVSIDGAPTGVIYANRQEAQASLGDEWKLVKVDVKPKRLGKPYPDILKIYQFERIEMLEIKNKGGK
jgi:hypothetical protein